MPKTTGSHSKPDLRLVAESEVYDLMRGPQTTADRVKQLQAEARALAVEQVEELERRLNEAAALAKEISVGGDAYPVGARAGFASGRRPARQGRDDQGDRVAPAVRPSRA